MTHRGEPGPAWLPGKSEVEVASKVPAWTVMLALMGLALVARLAMVRLDQVVHTDSVWYAVMGFNFARGRGLVDWLGNPVTFWSPLYPVALGLVSLVISNLELAGRLVSLVSSIACVPLIYLLGRRLYDRSTGYLGALLVALMPQLALQGIWMLSEALYTLLIVGGFLVLLESLSRARWAVVVGLLFGMAVLTRPEALVYVVVIALTYLGAFIVGRRPSYLGRFLPMMVSFGIAVVPYSLWLHSVTGQWALTGKADVNFAVDYLGWDVVETQHFSLTADGLHIGGFEATHFDFLRYAIDHPGQVVRHWRETFLAYWGELFNVGKPWFLPAFMLGIFGENWQGRRSARWLMVAPLAPLFALAFLHSDSRFITPMLPFLCLWAVRGFFVIGNWLEGALPWPWVDRQGMRHPVFALGATLLLLLWMSPLYLADRTSGYDPYNEPLEIKHAGEWILQNYGPEQVILSRRLQVAFYAQGKLVELPLADIESTLRYARGNGVRFFVVDSRTVPSQRPQLAPLMDSVPGGARLVYDRTEGGKYRVRIFELH